VVFVLSAWCYAPEIKRFINADSEKGSINNSKTLNLYVYAIGDPVKMVDPLGTSSDNWWNSTYESSFTWPSSSEILTDIGNDTLGGSTVLSKELLGTQTKNVKRFVDESGYIRGLPGNGLEVAKFPKTVEVLGKASDVITFVIAEFVIALPYSSAVFACAVPYLTTKKTTAITTYDFTRKTTATGFVANGGFSFLKLVLNKVVNLWFNKLLFLFIT
jgi:hypothetical protein